MHFKALNQNTKMTSITSLRFYPLEINGHKYLICKMPHEPFSTLHDPDTKRMVGQWNNDLAHYEMFSDYQRESVTH